MVVRPCCAPGCSTLVPFGRCPVHRSSIDKPISSPPSTPGGGSPRSRSIVLHHRNRAFYNSAAWRSTRAAYLLQHPLCEIGQCTPRAPAVEVHHRETIEEAPDKALEWGNLQASCKACHSRVMDKGDFGRP